MQLELQIKEDAEPSRLSRWLVASLIAVGVLSAYRAIHLWLTGFYVSDEYLYINAAFQGSVYGSRLFFGVLNTVLFRLFDIGNIDEYVAFLPGYLFLWNAITIIAAFETIRALGFPSRIAGLSVLFSIFMVSFSVVGLGFVTEPIGLGMIMLAILALVRYAASCAQQPFYPVLASAFIAGATSTRESYAIFIPGGLLLVVLLSISRMLRRENERRQGAWLRPLAGVLGFPIPAWLALSQQEMLLEQLLRQWHQFLKSFGVLFLPLGPVPLGTAQISDLPNAIGEPLPITMRIFLIAIVLGWGPVLLPLAVLGLAAASVRFARHRKPADLAALACVLLSLASLLGVALVFSDDRSYASFTHYSTNIRFASTTVPALYLTVPYAISRFSSKILALLLGVLVVSAAVAVPAYEAYLSSNLPIPSPFTFRYKTPDVEIRDYFLAHRDEAPFRILGGPPFFWFTPGARQLELIETHGYLPFSDFLKKRWDRFYIVFFVGYPRGMEKQYQLQEPLQVLRTGFANLAQNESYSYLFPIVFRDALASDSLPYRVLGTEIIVAQTRVPYSGAVFLIKVELAWKE